MRVDVVDGVGGRVRVLQRDRRRPRRLATVGPRLDHVMGIGGGAVAEQLGVGRRAAARGRFGLLQHEQRRALAHDEAVAPDVERSRGAVRLVVVARGQRPDDVERAERER